MDYRTVLRDPPKPTPVLAPELQPKSALLEDLSWAPRLRFNSLGFRVQSWAPPFRWEPYINANPSKARLRMLAEPLEGKTKSWLNPEP